MFLPDWMRASSRVWHGEHRSSVFSSFSELNKARTGFLPKGIGLCSELCFPNWSKHGYRCWVQGDGSSGSVFSELEYGRSSAEVVAILRVRLWFDGVLLSDWRTTGARVRHGMVWALSLAMFSELKETGNGTH